jgi:dynein heavy chain, axonemal
MPIGFGLTPVMGWDCPKVGGRAPSARAGHSMTVVPPAQAAGTTTRVVVFGGCSNSGPKNDTYELESARDGALRWVAIASTDAATTLAPPPRWRHSATLLGSSTVCVYGGSTDEGRLSDLWLLDTNSMAWSRPAQMSQEPAASVGAGSGALTQFGWPAPRASHTMNNIGGQLYLFAGYGGDGFERHDFNDLWVACPGNEQGRTQTPWSFRVLQPAGRWPAPRADHRASVVGHQLFVCGGWSALTQFRDLFVFDSVAVAWSQPDCGLPQPRWQHCLISAHSVPYSKLFMFGGEAGELDGQAQGSFCDGTSVLTCDSFTWSSPAVTGHLPSPRADSAAVLVGQRLIIWGGWASRWLGDLHTLDVGEIIGPPYNVCTITTAQPAPMGCDTPVIPVTGGTEIRITGQGLEPFAGQAATVRFSCASGSVDAAAAVLGDGETVRCLAPDLSVLGAVDCEVRLQVGFGHGWSLAKLRARVHTTTHAASTLAFGPGILRGNGLGAETTFVIQAVSADGSTRNTGGDQFRVLVAAFGEDKGGERPEVQVEDGLDGTYTVVYTAPHEGTYTVSIEFLGTFGGSSGPVQGSPFLASFEACAGTDVVNNSMSGGVLLRFIQRSTDDLDGELRKLERDLSSTVKRPPEGLAPLLKVKRALIAVQRRQEAQGGFLRSTRSALQYLDTVECMRVGKDIGHAKRVQVQFDKVQDLAPLAAELIVQETAVQKQRTKEGVGLYQKALENKQRVLRGYALWEYRTGYASAHEAIQEQQAALRAEAVTLATKSEHCEIFGFPALTVRCHELVLEMEREMLLMAAVWDTIEVVEHVIVAARAELWSAIKSDELIDSAKGLLRRVNDIDKAVKQCNAFRGVKADALDFVKQAELAQLLKGSPMQVRHWEELSRAVGQAFEPPPMNPRLKLGQLLDLGLHKAGDEVEDIADLSEKERKLGAILEEVGAGKGSWVGWRAAQWAMEPYQGTDTPVLTIDSDHYEILEKHQMDLQAQTTSKAMAHFHAEVVQWQQELNMVNEVFRLLNDMQRAWSYLEPLFVHSDEVRKELPETAALFLDIDAGVRAILSDAWATRVILLACNRDGLEGEISALNSRLALCKKALVDFLDGRRRQFPRFYFMSEADLLDVLSHGSQPSKVVAHVPKIFLATKTFELKDSSGRSVATHWVAIVGTERVSFEPEVKLEGKVEV